MTALPGAVGFLPTSLTAGTVFQGLVTSRGAVLLRTPSSELLVHEQSKTYCRIYRWAEMVEHKERTRKQTLTMGEHARRVVRGLVPSRPGPPCEIQAVSSRVTRRSRGNYHCCGAPCALAQQYSSQLTYLLRRLFNHTVERRQRATGQTNATRLHLKPPSPPLRSGRRSIRPLSHVLTLRYAEGSRTTRDGTNDGRNQQTKKNNRTENKTQTRRTA